MFKNNEFIKQNQGEKEIDNDPLFNKTNGFCDKEFSPLEYYTNLNGSKNEKICICTNQDKVCFEDICELCCGKIIR